MKKEIVFDRSKVEGWEFREIGENECCRLYWRQYTDMRGFEFVSFDVISFTVESDPFKADDTVVELLLHGVAYFDGIRHLYFGKEDNYGYFYYPRLKDISEILTILSELQAKYCET
jgi:hypothetical protein